MVAIVRTEWDASKFRQAAYRHRIGLMPSACQTMLGRFWPQVEVRDSGCWEWTGPLRTGYGRFAMSHQRSAQSHRLSYQWLRGDIPSDLEIDHLCRNRACVNPTHLEVVTHKENMRRGESPSARIARSGLCGKGHSQEGRVRRNCRACHREAQRRYAQRQGLPL